MKASAPVLSLRRRDPAIVLIADHVDQRRTLHVETLLFLSDYRIVEAAEARFAIERARRLRPRVLVMPLSLPGMEAEGGAIRVLKEKPAARDLHIIAIAEQDDPRGDKLAGELGVDVLVHEPCLPSEIVEHVRRCMAAGSAPRVAVAPGARLERRRPSEGAEAKKSSRPRERDPKATS